jgi:hypothetical protein
MSFQTLNTIVTFNWVLQPTDSAPVKADLDIILFKPDGTVSYTDDSALTYVAPTVTAQGKVTYNHTMNAIGLWKAGLSVGDSSAWVLSNWREVFIVDPPAHVTAGPTPSTTR